MSLVANNSFEEKYIALRKKENRIYSDLEVSQLPHISEIHPHYKEWLMRKESMRRFLTFLEKKKKPLRILEIGCGNGWLCNQLSKIVNVDVTGLDINSTELKQAGRVFQNNPRLHFFCADVGSEILAHEKFDVILFAASLQYFSSLDPLMNAVFAQLTEDGEVHIIDTHFYRSAQLAEAKKRTKDYFTAIGFPAMTNYYFHHSMDELARYDFRILHKASAIKLKFFPNTNPFPWICIKRR
jgi:ubiquinone/menaquinone biosynthesis C-methylase UbiE